MPKFALTPCYTFYQMAEDGGNLLDRAEALARRILDRLGLKLESQSAEGGPERLTARKLGDLVDQIQQIIERSLMQDGLEGGPLAPNRFKVLLTYEETSGVSKQYMEAVAKEVTSEIGEYIANRRYRTHGPVVVDVASDVLTKDTVIRHEFDGDEEISEQKGDASRHTGNTVATKTLSLVASGGKHLRLEMHADQGPIYAGRAGDCAIALKDPSISRVHCSIALRNNGDLVVADLGSANGTTINGRRLENNEVCPIRAGDRIGIGDVTLLVDDLV